MKLLLKHLKTVRTHRKYVRKMCWKLGLYWQGIVHDLSKYSITELKMCKYWTGKGSPHQACREAIGYSPSWIHHYHKNKHHYQYWWGEDEEGKILPIKMPYKYALELIADYLGAGKAYNGNNFSFKDELDWWRNHVKTIKMHDETKAFVTSILSDLANGISFKTLRQSKKYEIY